jgi:hypothetical protein
MSPSSSLLSNWQKLFRQYKLMAEKAISQVPDERLFWTFYNDSNSIAIIVQHMSGNMLSRFTNFYDEDGEKPWRNRDKEFESVFTTREEVMLAWDKGWMCLFSVLDSLTENDLEKHILIRSETHTVQEAFQRQLAHYSYHIGQLVYLSKMLSIENWKSLSIPKNGSDDFNRTKMG